MKSSEGEICGGYTSQNWDGSSKYVNDIEAFVFNMTNRYAPIDHDQAIYTHSHGF